MIIVGVIRVVASSTIPVRSTVIRSSVRPYDGVPVIVDVNIRAVVHIDLDVVSTTVIVVVAIANFIVVVTVAHLVIVISIWAIYIGVPARIVLGSRLSIRGGRLRSGLICCGRFVARIRLGI